MREARPQIEAVMQGRSVRYVRERPQADGSVRYYEVQVLPHTDASGAVVGAFALLSDITHHRLAEHAARDAAERLHKFAEATSEGVAFHKDTLITDVNDAMLRITGYSRAELLGRRTLEFVAPGSQKTVVDYISDRREDPYEAALVHRDGHEIPVEMVAKTMRSHGETWRLVVVRDISAHKEAQRRIEFLAHHDTLTQLPNRAHLHERLVQVLAMARRERRMAAVLFIDLDNFKRVNDSLGHHAGDRLLCEVARRLTAGLRHSDVVARLGGDEFVAVLADVTSAQVAGLVAAKLLAAIGLPVGIDGHQVATTPSIGIGMYPEHGDTAEELLRNADAAMYHAKDLGRGNAQFFDASLIGRAGALLGLEAQLREAVARQALELHYQPIWRMADGAMVAVEALVRWRHPRDGLLGPEVFIGLAESRGLIGAIGRWVLREACSQMKAWHDAGHDPPDADGQHVGHGAAPQPSGRGHRRRAAGQRPAGAAAGDRADRVRLHGPRWPGAAGAGAGQGIGRAAGDRRFRHRLFVAGLPQAPSDRHAQGGPQLRARPAGCARRPGHRPGHRADGAHTGPAHRGRRHRNGRAVRRAAGDGLR